MSDDLFKGMDVVEDSSSVEIGDHPLPNSPEWSDYLMGLLGDDEKVDGKPLVAGLRRLAEMFLGEIWVSGPTQVFPSSSVDHPGRATVVFTVQFASGRTYSEVADSWVGNTDEFVAVYPVATASTRAEARALRKALKLKVVAAEEITTKNTSKVVVDSVRTKTEEKPKDGEFAENTILSAKQDNFIQALCDRADINKERFIEFVLGVKDSVITKKLASEAIELLNSYINKSKNIPEQIINSKR
jgi:ribonuclease HI